MKARYSLIHTILCYPTDAVRCRWQALVARSDYHPSNINHGELGNLARFPATTEFYECIQHVPTVSKPTESGEPEEYVFRVEAGPGGGLTARFKNAKVVEIFFERVANVFQNFAERIRKASTLRREVVDAIKQSRGVHDEESINVGDIRDYINSLGSDRYEEVRLPEYNDILLVGCFLRLSQYVFNAVVQVQPPQSERAVLGPSLQRFQEGDESKMLWDATWWDSMKQSYSRYYATNDGKLEDWYATPSAS